MITVNNTYLEGTLSSGFLPTITLPTRLSKNSTLIDNIFLNKQEKLNFAGILHNEISDHQVIAINMNVVLSLQKTVYVIVLSNSDQSKQNFKNDFEAKKIYARLNTVPDSNPNDNYCILETAVIESMSNHLQEKVVRFNKKKHKRDTWMTYGILKLVNHKNKLYKELMKLNRNSTEYYNNNKQEFNDIKMFYED